MACVSKGPIEATLASDEEGYDTITVKFKVQGIPGQDGPGNAKTASGLPLAGEYWGKPSSGAAIFSGESHTGLWCRPSVSVEPHPETRPDTKPSLWIVTKVFSNKPTRDGQGRCPGEERGDPWNEKQKITRDHSEEREEASRDRFGKRILTSSLEPVHGPNNEWGVTRTTIRIEQNVIDPQFPLIELMKDSVNAYELWGFPPRTIRFRPGGEVQKFCMSGGVCVPYWTRTLLFELRYRRYNGAFAEPADTGTGIELTAVPQGDYETWDRDVWDEGTRVLRGRWTNAAGQTGTGTSNRSHWQNLPINGEDPDPSNPHHFIKFKDWNGENTKTLLDGFGNPAFVPTISYEWWVIRTPNNFAIPGMGDPAYTYRKVHTTCKAALNMALDEHLFAVTGTGLFGPFGTEANADVAIQANSLGSEVPDCNDEPTVGVIHIEKYGGADFRLLGIPLDLLVPAAPFSY